MTITDNKKFLRVMKLWVHNKEKGLTFNDFRVRFNINAMQRESPNSAEITIYNLKDETTIDIQKEFTDVSLEVGYEGGDLGEIFAGSITQFKFGKEDHVNKFLTIYAADGDVAYNQDFVKVVVPAGTNALDEINQASADLPNVKLGYVPNQFTLTGINPQSTLIRDKVLFGLYRQVARQLAKKHDMSWSIQKGKVVYIPNDGYLPGTAVKLNALTGLVGIPEQTDEGIRVRCLIDPNIKVGGLIEVNNKDITQSQFRQLFANQPEGTGLAYNAYGVMYASATSPDGLYMVFSIDYSGDTRGHEWYSDIICLRINRNVKDAAHPQGTVEAKL